MSGCLTQNGYPIVWCPDHPRQHNGYVFAHILAVEKALGRPLLPGETPHHRDLDKTNNTPGNFLVFKNHAMHLSYHHRLLAFAVTGHYDWRKCCLCHQYDGPDNLYIHPTQASARHRSCHAQDMRQRKGVQHHG